MYCILSIPQCCDASRPAVYQPCQSLCTSEAQNCYGNVNMTIACPSSLWYQPPCNSGTGINC